MKLKLSILGLALASAMSAQAGVVTLDDFSIAQTPAFAPPINQPSSVTGGTYWTTRTINFTAATGTNNTINAEVTGAASLYNPNTFTIANGPSNTSTTTLSWALNSAALSPMLAGATFVQIDIEQVKVDVGTVTVGGNARTTNTVPLIFSIFSGAAASITNPFTVDFVSTRDADSVWRNVTLSYSCRAGATSITAADLAGGDAGCATNVPLPGTAALLGLGLLGAGFLRRKSA